MLEQHSEGVQIQETSVVEGVVRNPGLVVWQALGCAMPPEGR